MTHTPTQLKKVNLSLDPKRPRLTPKQVAAVLRESFKGSSSRIPLDWVARSLSEYKNTGGGRLACSAALYQIVFSVDFGVIKDCPILITPSGQEYFQDQDGGSPLSLLTVNEVDLIHERLTDPLGKIITFGVVERFVIVKNPGMPDESVVGRMMDKGAGANGISFPQEIDSFTTFKGSEEAHIVLAKLKRYMDDLGKKLQKKK